jgi:Fis family transcriptional regulator, factor for inversion stimulation protein
MWPARLLPWTSALKGLFAVVNAVPVLQADVAAESVLQPALRECVARAVRRYLTDLDAQMPEGLYDLVLHEVEAPLLREVLTWSGGNQSKAATALGINRATLRKKLAARGLG